MKTFPQKKVLLENIWTHFIGMMLSIALVVPSGATLNGRALAQTAVALDTTTITKPGNVAVMEDNNLAPHEYTLSQGFPNSFNPSATIRYALLPNKKSFVKIIVSDILGKEIIVLLNEEKDPGEYEITINTKELASGIYFYIMRTREFVKSMKMIFVK